MPTSPDPANLQRLARASKAAAAALSAQAAAFADLAIEVAALDGRVRLGEDAPPCSWEVEREAFLRRLFSD